MRTEKPANPRVQDTQSTILRYREAEFLYAGIPAALTTHGVAAFLLVVIQGGSMAPRPLLGWLAATLGILLVRLWLVFQWEREVDGRETQSDRWIGRFRLSIFVNGLTWGAAALLLFPVGDPAHQFFLAFALAGLCAGAITTLAVDRVSVVAFVVPALFPLTIRFAQTGDQLSWVMATLLWLYMPFIVASAGRVGMQVSRNNRLQIDAVLREQVLMQSEERLNQAQQIAQLGSFEWELATDQIRWSDEHFRCWGLLPGSTTPTRTLFRQAIHREDRPRVDEALAAVRGRGQDCDCVYRVCWPDGSVHHIHWRGEVSRGPDGEPWRMVGTVQDISERKAAEDRIRELAFYDPLTHIANRHLLLERLEKVRDGSASGRHCCALLLIDLDNFKNLNDTLGHNKGDLLLTQVAERLAHCVRQGDTLARLGGDEFVVLLDGLSADPAEAAAEGEVLAARILAALQEHYDLGGHEYHGTCSIGVTVFQGHQDSIEDLLKRADLAMYQSKDAGRNALRLFDHQMEAVVTASAALEADLRQALGRREFELHYQVQVDREGRVTGAEALLRWKHARRGVVSPADFIPIAEKSGLIIPIGQWVLEVACLQLAAWSRRPETRDLTLAVNVSARQFRHPEFVDQVMAVLQRTGANPQRLKIELTESMLVEHIEGVIEKMMTLKGQGLGFSLDDFGTGYSCLSYLQRLPLEQLKIAQNFVRDVLTDPKDAAIARNILALGQSMGLNVIAEGVETEGQRDFLAANGCDAYQGYLFGRPEPWEEFDRHLVLVDA